MVYSRRLELALQGGAVFLLIVAAVALLWRPSLPAGTLAPSELRARPSNRAANAIMEPAATEPIITSNIFSQTRAAPRARYSPLAYDGDGAAPEPARAAGNDATTRNDHTGIPELFGTVMSAQGASALMRLDPASPGAQVYHEGEHGGNYRVVRITERSVILDGPAGRVLLQLSRPEGQTP